MTTKKHGNSGNKNAAKPDPKNARLSFRCHAHELEQWQQSADSEKISINEWAIAALNHAAKR